jgi:hypothetical protein
VEWCRSLFVHAVWCLTKNRRAYRTVLALVHLLNEDDPSRNPLDVLVEGGLPRAFLLTRERLEKPVNLHVDRPHAAHDTLGGETPVEPIKAKS